MKRRDLIKLLERNGWWLKREGHDHTIYTNGTANEPVSHQTEINELLAKKIIKRRGLK
ncbi:type II toxin-antitoxin system HicA family toxin [Christensenellaceae bacterium OttesenSCG-928-L17]|nr:type II toxin-antitoxin system HicA family toxin [Christensenellaceae bacterium OttesenSCG-928-L17]